MIISLVVAIDEKRGIGKEGKLPWRLSADLKRFREVTMGHHLIVGRKTFESIGRPLPGRQTILVTRNPDLKPEGVVVVHSVEDAIALAQERGETEAFVIGGAEIYARTIEAADRIYLTEVHAEVAADVFFPEFYRDEWIETQRIEHSKDEKNEHAFTFVVLERVTP
nr:Dihydrofolate reductase [uncultured bacterium]AIA16172.1 Dihydrofolate reductase [uncultured bacterium]AIA16390.1 Dihydrofolate reductase [uncultured bacterium]